jgi:hypothetical protein
MKEVWDEIWNDTPPFVAALVIAVLAFVVFLVVDILI